MASERKKVFIGAYGKSAQDTEGGFNQKGALLRNLLNGDEAKRRQLEKNTYTSVMQKALFTLCLSLLPLLCFPQKEANLWYFGFGAGLDFSGGTPVVLTNSGMDIWEGCATISDSSGHLLFYTSGEAVFNAAHDTMANGDNMAGVGSVTQSSMIVPRPQVPDHYYIFTTDALENNLTLGLRYSLVDMALENGLGRVVQKSFPLFAPNTERVTAVRHGNGIDYWVLAHGYNTAEFRAYLVDSSGVNLSPVITVDGAIHSNLAMSQGAIKASPAGDKVAIAIKSANLIEVYDFDNQTGRLSNRIDISGPGISWTYGLEFSCDGQRLYQTGVSNKYLVQIDLAAGSPQAVANSAQIVDSLSTYANGTLQLGPDGRIYLAKDNSPYLAAINFPQNLGAACGLQDSALYLGGAMSGFGLPNHLNHFFSCSEITHTDQIQMQEEIEVFPIPAEGEINLKLPSETDVLSLHVYNLEGKQMPVKIPPKQPGPQTFSIELGAGIYFLRLKDSQGRLYRKKIWMR